MMRSGVILACLSCLAPPALAQDLLQRPESCERTATAQYSGCEVSNYFSCADTNPAAYRVESIDEEGVTTVESYDENFGAVGLADSSGELKASFDTQTTHPRFALEAGRRDEQFEASMDVLGATMTLRGASTYRFTGETVLLAGETFHRIPFDGEIVTSGTVFGTPMDFTMTAEGSMIFNDRLNLWLEEVSRTRIDGEPEEVSRLRRLSLPGQEGFGIEAPHYDCGGISFLPASALGVPA